MEREVFSDVDSSLERYKQRNIDKKKRSAAQIGQKLLTS